MEPNGPVGKRVLDDLYVHLQAVDLALGAEHRAAIKEMLESLSLTECPVPNVVKLNLRDGRLSLLSYPNFERAAFPQLSASWTRAPTGEVRHRTYADSLNPPILHRKELLVPNGWPGRERWSENTKLAESLGLFDAAHMIGFRGNWQQLLTDKGYQVVENDLLPIGNIGPGEFLGVRGGFSGAQCIQRHLTALSRTGLSAPVQLLLRTGLLTPDTSIFDYGCGKGDDVRGLAAEGFRVSGWDPHYAPDEPRAVADVVNLGFVLNVIEDPLERAEALRGAASLCQRVLVASVMLHNSSSGGVAFNDGVLSSRNTFQKYFSQDEFRDYLEHALGFTVIMGGPGIALVFKDREWEQRFLMSRMRKRDVAARVLATASRVPRASKPPHVPRVRQPTPQKIAREELRPLLSRLWETALELGRWPFPDEVPHLEELTAKGGSLPRVLRIVQRTCDNQLLEAASQSRRDDLLLFLAMQQFSKRPAYKRLDERLQRDIKSFFGAYGAAHAAAARLLRDSGDPQKLLEASQEAASRGLGYLDGDHSLQLHVSLLDRLPAVLRAYAACGMVLWDETSAVQIVKIHIGTGKLTLLEFEDFDAQWLPRLQRRVKINLRRLDYRVFEYGGIANPCPVLYFKSRYINEEYECYEKQMLFDEALAKTDALDGAGEYGVSEAELVQVLERRRLKIGSAGLEPSDCIPDLDQACGANITYRDFIECGETQKRLGIRNIPLRPETYNALHALAVQVLDPVIDYFGAIRLTYGFCSPQLGKNIKQRVAPKLDQHAGCELGRSGALVCDRGGISCDFLVEDENMRDVVDWIINNVGFDRIYYYGADRPVHVSFGPQNSMLAYEMRTAATGALVPRRYSPSVTSVPP